jgi:Probable Zinc-ribbon domain
MENSLRKLFPSIAREAFGWDPGCVSSGSNRKLDWQCSLGHVYAATVVNRTRANSGCPYCANRKVYRGFNDLATTHPDIAAEAYEFDPTQVLAGSALVVTWQCAASHTYEQSLVKRTARNYGCPYCSGAKVLTGFNDLETLFVELAAQAYGWDPKEFTSGSGRKLHWKCTSNHIWSAAIKDRVKGHGCPICSNRRILAGFNDLATLNPEVATQAHGWDPSEVGVESKRKVEWRCSEGHVWLAAPVHRVRHGQGCAVCVNMQINVGVNDLATTHPEIAQQAFGWDPRSVVAGSHKRLVWQCQLGHKWSAQPNARTGGKGCPYCAGRYVLRGFNDLQTTHPSLAREAFNWDATTLSAGSGKRVTWICKLGHVFITSASHRVHLNQGCPICANQKVLPGFNDLATTHPQIAREAFGWDASTVFAGSNRRLHWRCEEGHEWVTSPHSRSGQGAGCPTCAKSGYDPNAPGWLYLIENLELGLLQVGITNDPAVRLKAHGRRKWESVDLRGPMDGVLARDWEKAILKYIDSLGVALGPIGSAGTFDGYTESWRAMEFRTRSLRSLMDLVDEWESGLGKS